MTGNEYDLKTAVYGPESGGRPDRLVILLHGLGADGRDLIGLAPLFAKFLPHTVFVSPDAPFPCDMAPFGCQWFSLQDRSRDAVLRGVRRAAPILDSFIASQMDKYGIAAENTALAGFSQGTMMSLYVAPRFPEKLAGVLGYSGALIGGDELDAPGILRPPVHLIHGDADPVVPVEAYEEAESALRRHGFTISGGITPGLQHNIDQAGIASGAQFLQKILSAQTAAA